MGRFDKKVPIIEWLKRINSDSSIFTRQFFKLACLFDLYQQIKKSDNPTVTLASFKRLIDSICSNNIYKNLKRKTNLRVQNRRLNEYILLLDNEIDVDVDKINVYITRKRKTQANAVSNNLPSHEDSLVLPPKKKQPTELPTDEPSTNTPTELPTDDPSTNTPTELPTNVTIQYQTFTPTSNCIPMPVVVPIPYAVPIPVSVSPSSNTQTERISPIIQISKIIDLKSSPKATKYIEQSRNLDFVACPRKNIFCPWLEDIKTNTKTCDDHFKLYLMQIASELHFEDFRQKEQLVLAEAIIKKESFVAGFDKPIMSARHFKDRIWDNYKKSMRTKPSMTSHILDNHRGENRMSYVAQIMKKYPTMLHSMYRFATKLLGLDETSAKLSEAMNTRAKELFPDCPVRSNLKMNRNRFWEFFMFMVES